MINRYGLDSAYFKDKLGELARDSGHYTPAEMQRALNRLAAVAATQNRNRFGGGTAARPTNRVYSGSAYARKK